MKRSAIFILLLLAVIPTTSAHAQLALSAKSSGVIAPMKKVTLEFRVGEKRPTVDELAYLVFDYTGARVDAGKAGYVSKLPDSGISLSLTLPPGYYDITFPTLNQTFGVICLDMPRGRKDPFFCLDAGLSWITPEQAPRQRLISLMQQLGIDIARERVWWGSINSGVGKFSWDGDRYYEDLRKRYELIGLGVLEVFHDTPEHLGPTEQNCYPADLVGASQAWAAIANRWQNAHAGIEVWNEPDISFGKFLPADQYVPLVKAISRGLSSAKIRTPLGGGVLATPNDDAFLRGLAGNGLMRAVDFISWHNYYDEGETIRKQVTKMRQWLDQSGAPGAGIWLTECGKSWPTKAGDRATQADDAAAALSIVAKAVEARACGVERYFPFVLPFYAEGDRNYSMTGKDGSPLRSLAAYGACISVLSNKAYVGDLVELNQTRLQSVQNPPIFADDATAVIVLYSDLIKLAEEKPDAPNKRNPRHWFDWNTSLPIIKILGIDGRELKIVDDDGNKMIPLNDGLAYVFVAVKDLDKYLAVETDRMKLTRLARQPRERGPLSAVVLQHLPDFASVTATIAGYKITKGDAKQWPIAIRVNNFSHGEELTLTVRAVPGNAEPPAATKPAALDQKQPNQKQSDQKQPDQKPLAAKKITLEPGKNADVTLTVDLTQTNNEVLITIGDDTNELDRMLIQFVK